MRKRASGRVSGVCVALALMAGTAWGQCVDAIPTNPCAPGGGSPATDCQLEWAPVPVPPLDRKSAPMNKVVCREGDPMCDADPDLSNASCTLRSAVCINNADPRLPRCAPSEIGTFELLRPRDRPDDAAATANRAALEGQFGGGPGGFGVTVRRRGSTIFAGTANASQNLCSTALDFVVPLHRSGSGRLRRGMQKFTVKTIDASGRRDVDKLTLECVPSVCGDHFVDPGEGCDDGNRINGDGCDRDCQVEQQLTPTPAATATPTSIPPPTPTPRPGEVRLLPGGGVSGSCRGTCVGGTIPGGVCDSNVDCGAGGTCASRVCAGGALAGTACTGATQCNGCSLNPPQGSCIILQNPLFPVPVALNGVCVPRTAPDVTCVTDTECPAGKTCQLPGFVLDASAPHPVTQEAPVSMPASQVVFPPALVPGIGWACVSVPSDGAGVIDCDGGRSDLDQSVTRDHNTTPGDPNNGGGMPDDPDCDDACVLPNGLLSYACAEGSSRCVGGANAGAPCTLPSDCDSGVCALCSSLPVPHAGVCNSPACTSASGTFGAGDVQIVAELAVSVVQPSLLGPDGLACTPDDMVGSTTATPVLLGSGDSDGTIFDAANTAGTVVGPAAQCTSAPCIASVSGAGVSCSALASGQTAGLTLGGITLGLDTLAGDTVMTFQFVGR